jgi:hypothetical protein|tara:strand:+ start:768 stop:971 length:204 start_codon:yes stop_codon:yes gene_type:complete
MVAGQARKVRVQKFVPKAKHGQNERLILIQAHTQILRRQSTVKILTMPKNQKAAKDVGGKYEGTSES